MRPELLTPLQGALSWLRESGVQVPSSAPDGGGVHAWIDEATGKSAFLYSEITGYFMTLCTHIARFDPQGDWNERADAAAGWIVENALLDCGALLPRKYADPLQAASDPYSFENRRSLFFDCAMVGYGLLRTYTATRNERWLESARRLGSFVLRSFESPDHRKRHAAFDLSAHRADPPGPRWSQHFGSFQLKGALFLDALAAATGDAAPRGLLERILDQALSAQHSSGRFATDLEGQETHLHPHHYTVEGLLYLAARHSRRDLLEPARRAIDWAMKTCLRPGDEKQQWSERPARVIRGLRSDVLAQALRAYEISKVLDPDVRWSWEDDLPALYARLASFALPSGGTSYGEDEHGRKSTHANAWCHFFAIEAVLLRHVREGGVLVDPRTLILT